MARRYLKERKVPSQRDKVKALVDKWYFMDVIGFHGGTKAFGNIHKELLNWYDSDDRPSKRDIILMPRGHLKTTIVTVLDILYSIYVNPNIRIYIGSANKALGKAILREVKANLVDSWLQENVWNVRPHIEGRLIPLMDKLAQSRRNTRRNSSGDFSEWDDELLTEEASKPGDLDDGADKKVMWTQEAIQVLRPYNLREPTVVVGSVDTPATGFHYDKLYFDDIINFDNYNKPEKIERLDTWRNDMFSVLDDEYWDEDLNDWLNGCSRSKSYREKFKHLSLVGGDCTVVGTRYFRHDWYKQVIDDENTEYRIWLKNIYKNGENPDDGYIWDERWSKSIETKKRKEMSKKHFYAQYLNKVIVTEDQILPFDKIRFLSMNNVVTKDGSNRAVITVKDENGEDRVREIVLQAVVDPAVTCNKDSDFTACVIGGKDSDKNLYVLDVKLWKLTPDKWVKEMFKLLSKWNIKSIHLETVGFFVTMKNTIRDKFKEFYPIGIRDYRPSQKSTKKERIESGLEPLMSNGMLYMMGWCKQNTELVDQFNFFPSETVHDDGVDAVQMLNEVTKPTRPTDSKSKVVGKNPNRKYGGYY